MTVKKSTTVKLDYRQGDCIQLHSPLHISLNSTDRILPGIHYLLEHRVLAAVLSKTEAPYSSIFQHTSSLQQVTNVPLFSELAEKQGNHHPVGKTPMKSVIIHSYVKDCEDERKCDKLIHSNKERL